jgi:hypothetical protein
MPLTPKQHNAIIFSTITVLYSNYYEAHQVKSSAWSVGLTLIHVSSRSLDSMTGLESFTRMTSADDMVAQVIRCVGKESSGTENDSCWLLKFLRDFSISVLARHYMVWTSIRLAVLDKP